MKPLRSRPILRAFARDPSDDNTSPRHPWLFLKPESKFLLEASGGHRSTVSHRPKGTYTKDQSTPEHPIAPQASSLVRGLCIKVHEQKSKGSERPAHQPVQRRTIIRKNIPTHALDTTNIPSSSLHPRLSPHLS